MMTVGSVAYQWGVRNVPQYDFFFVMRFLCASYLVLRWLVGVWGLNKNWKIIVPHPVAQSI